MNMSYCKMENTNLALAQCLEDLEAVINGNVPESGEPLSQDECDGAIGILDKAAQLVKLLEEAMGDDWRDKSALAAMFSSSANSTVGDKLEEEGNE